MRNITAYSRLLESLDLLSESLSRSIVHVGDENLRIQLSQVDGLRDSLRAGTVDRPDEQIDEATLSGILDLYEAACRARFFAGSESAYDRFQAAAGAAERSAGLLYPSRGSESWGRFPPR